jgi:hypothetical protein
MSHQRARSGANDPELPFQKIFRLSIEQWGFRAMNIDDITWRLAQLAPLPFQVRYVNISWMSSFWRT